MQLSITAPRNMLQAYTKFCKPLCKKLELPQTAFDILMFLGNNPQYKTARDVVEIRHIKANLVSVNVDKLVNEGYLIRQAVEGDRRKTELICTDKAKPIIEKGQKLQQEFLEKTLANMDQDTREALAKAMEIINENANRILEGDR
ncbi:MAG: helix-turn-helix domain-containing protein [Clostridia bacterium]|nr:helix-turn-helix domain-containing protein [Clostridia bacterium]